MKKESFTLMINCETKTFTSYSKRCRYISVCVIKFDQWVFVCENDNEWMNKQNVSIKDYGLNNCESIHFSGAKISRLIHSLIDGKLSIWEFVAFLGVYLGFFVLHDWTK